jgi:hypothetical protein
MGIRLLPPVLLVAWLCFKTMVKIGSGLGIVAPLFVASFFHSSQENEFGPASFLNCKYQHVEDANTYDLSFADFFQLP